VARLQQWSDDLRQQARVLYERDGLQLASSVTSIPSRTIRAWAQQEQWRKPGKGSELRVATVAHAPQRPAKGEVVALGYGHTRRSLLRQMGELAAQAAVKASEELASGHTIKARDCGVLMGIAVDKAEQLAKAAGDQGGGHPEMTEVVGPHA
jgi:hypothetical protein